MKLSSIPVVKLPLVDVSTDPLDLLVAGLALRMKQLARTSPNLLSWFMNVNSVFKLGLIWALHVKLLSTMGKLTASLVLLNKPTFILQFADSEQGVKTLMKGDPTAFMTGMQNGSIKMEGDFGLLVWFNKVAKVDST